MLYSLDRVTSADRVQEVITKAIILGDIRPGDALVEAKISRQLGVSRGPVREALAQLEYIGLVEKIPYKGSFVSQLTSEDVRDLYTIRSRVEGLAARINAERRDPKTIAVLESILAQMRLAAEAEDSAALVECDLHFHDTICALSDHKLLYQLWTSHLAMHLKRFLLLKRRRLYANPGEAVMLHQNILAAIRDGDPDTAEAVAMQHVIDAGERHLARGVTHENDVGPGAKAGA